MPTNILTQRLPPVRLRDRNKHEACTPSSAIGFSLPEAWQTLRVLESLRFALTAIE